MVKQLRFVLTLVGFTLALVAVSTRIWLSSQGATAGIPGGLYVLGYFTLQSNIMVIAWYLGVLLTKGSLAITKPTLHGAILVYISMTGLVYNLLLAATWNPQGLDLLTETINHTVTPLIFFLVWLLSPQAKPVHFGPSMLTLLYPTIYAIFGILEGTLLGTFRYFFLDYTNKPWDVFTLTLLGVTAGFFVLTVVVWYIRRLVKRPRN